MHLVDHIKHKELKSDSTLHVIGVVSNYARFHSRYRLFREWAAEMMATKNVRLHVVEATYGDRHEECRCPDDSYSYMSVNTKSEVWIKENLINLGVRHLLPSHWKYMAWVDCDIQFRNPNWALETIHQLQHYAIVQPWSDAVDLAFDGSIMKHFKSFGYFSAKNISQCQKSEKNNPYKHPYGHTGYSLAFRRGFYEHVEKLLDFGILGSGDAHALYACVGRVQETINHKMSDGYKHLANLWQDKAVSACNGVVGFTPGRIEHHFHGCKQKRQYASRWQILVRHHFDPMKDLKYDHQGVLRLRGKHKLEQAIMRYNRDRCEDDIS